MTAPVRALLIDMDGVLYQGSRVVPGAVEVLRWLNEQRIPHLFVTNTTSRPRPALIEKLAGMGIRVSTDAILTPPVAAVRWLSERVDGPVALFVPEATRVEFAGLACIGPQDPEPDRPVAAVVIGDYGESWTYAALNRAFRWLMQPSQPPLVALGMTRYWQAEDGLRLDTAPFVVALAHAIGREPVVLGKPAGPFFQAALDQLGVGAEQTLMIGDDIRGDVGGAQAAGIAGLLVKTGKYRPRDLAGGIEPRDVLESIAELPAWWERVV
jgi:HAD superfamily hydrolase (TIGR01458 family)